jgi:hypothetical protein
VTKRDNFEFAFFTLRDTIWIGALGPEPKNGLLSFSMDSGFLPQAECSVNFFLKARPKLKVVGDYI